MSAKVFQFSTAFSRFPGGRYREDGKWSGQQFYEDVLLPMFQRSEPIVLDLSGAMGFATSFLDGAFGEFAAQHGSEAFDTLFEVQVTDDATLLKAISACLDRGDEEYRKR